MMYRSMETGTELASRSLKMTSSALESCRKLEHFLTVAGMLDTPLGQGLNEEEIHDHDPQPIHICCV
jgi:hypothetical protein